MDTRTVAMGAGCSRWRVVLAFSFIVAFLFLFTGFLVRKLRSHTINKRPAILYLTKTPLSNSVGPICVRHILQSGLIYHENCEVSTAARHHCPVPTGF